MKVILPAIIAGAVALLGIVISYFLNKKSIKAEIEKQKANIHLNEIRELPEKIYQLMHDAFGLQSDNIEAWQDFSSRMGENAKTVFAYGSLDAIKIIVAHDEKIYANGFNPNKIEQHTSFFCTMILLACQIKCDLTGITISPDYWYRELLSDYSKHRDIIISTNNEIVRKLELDDFLLIK